MESETSKQKEEKQIEEKPEKIEICYTCGKKFNINADDFSHYHYDKYPMCDYCSDFYRFYR